MIEEGNHRGSSQGYIFPRRVPGYAIRLPGERVEEPEPEEDVR